MAPRKQVQMFDHRSIRSQLSVPAGSSRMLEKALQSEADAFFLDLEDATAPDRKATARATVVESLQHVDWGHRERVVRINAIGTAWCLRDLIALIGEAPCPPDRLVVPKVRSAGDIAYLDRVLDQLMIERGEAGRSIAYEIQIEDHLGLGNLDAILAESHRTSTVTFGQGDFAAATGMPADEIGVADEWDRAVAGDRWLVPRQLIVFAAARGGCHALNGPYAAYRDEAGFQAYCRMSRALGFGGVWCIHPAQIETANDVFMPSDAEIERARDVLAAVEAGWDSGSGAISREGVMTDEANMRMARAVLARAERAGTQKRPGSDQDPGLPS